MKAKNILKTSFNILFYCVVFAMGFKLIAPRIFYDPPLITQVSDLCEVADGIAYRVVIDVIDSLEPTLLWREIRDLKRMGVREIHFYVNSGGGVIFDGFALHDKIREASRDGFFTVGHGDGTVISAAILVLSCCDHRSASENCVFFVHKPYSNKTLLSKADKEILEFALQRYAEVLGEETNLTAKEWRTKMEEETWFTAQEALEWGLIDEIR